MDSGHSKDCRDRLWGIVQAHIDNRDELEDRIKELEEYSEVFEGLAKEKKRK